MTANSASENDGAFQEVWLLGITPKSGSATQFAASMEEVGTLKEGDKDGSSIVTGAGGRIWKRTPQGDNEVVMKIYPLDTDVSDGNDMKTYFAGSAELAGKLYASRDRSLHQLAYLMTDDPDATTAEGTTSSGYAARRTVMQQMRCTGYDETPEDKVWVARVTFKGPPFDQDGSSKCFTESVTSQEGGLTSLDSY